jgi:hypothetical protein
MMRDIVVSSSQLTQQQQSDNFRHLSKSAKLYTESKYQDKRKTLVSNADKKEVEE